MEWYVTINPDKSIKAELKDKEGSTVSERTFKNIKELDKYIFEKKGDICERSL